ncbi:MAG: hypothetical protein OXC62_17425 [Aestuariivita sp.]|nr:hypothetical protein [Aestuariivita sp.]
MTLGRYIEASLYRALSAKWLSGKSANVTNQVDRRMVPVAKKSKGKQGAGVVD